jgi:hypothetical protein
MNLCSAAELGFMNTRPSQRRKTYERLLSYICERKDVHSRSQTWPDLLKFKQGKSGVVES